ncbi:hypothetical protein DH2020_043655 [Rehmannia glutinosa]|uniref:DUF4283 domain-containing protein n=1 Tax=Rehmannia glutinosa TaxID=99300 RepID=A0ABR0UJX6_REHGL
MEFEEVCGRWRNLTITEAEQEEIGIGDSLVEEGKSLVRKGLIGKLLTKHPYNITSFKASIPRLWRILGQFEIVDVAQDTFFFIFGDQNEMERVLDFEPWTFNRSLLVLQEFEGLNFKDVSTPSHTRFWIQVHNLPDFGLTEKIGRIIGDGLGISLEVDADPVGRCLGSYLRVRTLIDVSKPLRRGALIRLGSDGAKRWVDFKYERIPDFCYVYGIIGDPPLRRWNPTTSVLSSGSSSSNSLQRTHHHMESSRNNTPVKGSMEESFLLPNQNALASNLSDKHDSIVGASSADPNLQNMELTNFDLTDYSKWKDKSTKTTLPLSSPRKSLSLSPGKGLSLSPGKVLFHFGTNNKLASRSHRNWKSEARRKGASKLPYTTSITPVKRKVTFPNENNTISPKRREVTDPNSLNALSAEVASQPRRAQ